MIPADEWQVTRWRTGLVARLADPDPGVSTRALLELTYEDPDRPGLESLLLAQLGPEVELQLRGLAVTCLGHVARLYGTIGGEAVRRLRELLSDPDLGGRAEDALDDIAAFAPDVDRPG